MSTRTDAVRLGAMTVAHELPDLPQKMHLPEILWHALRQNVHLDESNAAIHWRRCATRL